jgi:hypothetical protein
MSQIFDLLTTLEAHKDTIISYAKFIGVLVFGLLLLSSLFRFIFGKKAQLNHAVSSSVEILCLYIINIVLYSFGLHWELFLSPLPFISIAQEQLTLFIFESATFDQICTEILSMIILSFLVNLLDSLLPKGEKLLEWFAFRVATVVIAMAAHWLVCQLLTAFLPDVVVTYAPMILLGILVVMLSVGIFKYLVGAAIATVNPIIGAIYTFFFANLVGKQITKAVLSTALLSGLIFGLNVLGITTVSIAPAALMAYFPILIILVAVWYVINRIL